MNDFNEMVLVSDYIAPCPSQYALQHLEDFEYLELWYLTQEGCADAAQNLCTINEDSFSITKVDNIMSLKSISSIWALKNVVQDIDLTW